MVVILSVFSRLTVDFSDRFCFRIFDEKIFFENKLESYGRLEVPKLSSWAQMKNLVKTQTKLMRIAWGVGIGSTLVVTAYTLQENVQMAFTRSVDPLIRFRTMV